MDKRCVDIDDVLDLFEISDEDIYAKGTIEDALYDGTLKVYKLPSAQPEIIRCKNCMFWRRDRISCEGYAMCQTGEGGIRFRRENDYCSVARRRTDE